MTISSVSSSVPPTPVVSTDSSQQQTPPVKTDSDSDDTSSQQVRAPLPPGQGTRVDQLA
jgi:hypothetical protein